MRIIVYLILAAFAAVSLRFGHEAYQNLTFTGDGFSYFTAALNTIRGLGGPFMFEGPNYEHLIGMRLSLGFYLLIPFVAIWNSPEVLLVVTILSHVVATFILSCISYRKGLSDLSWALFILFYLFHPLAFYWLYGEVYLFLPDLLLPPLFFLLCWAFEKNHFYIVAVLASIMASLKDEALLFVPGFIAILVIAIPKEEILKKLRPTIATYSATVLLTVFIYLKINPMNIHKFLYSENDLFFVFQADQLLTFCIVLLEMTFPLIMAHILVSKNNPERKRLTRVFLLTILLISIRLYAHTFAYKRLPYFIWNNSWIAPLVAFGLICYFGSWERKRRGLIPYFILLCIGLHIPKISNCHSLTIWKGDLTTNRRFREELLAIDGALPISNKIEPILTHQYFIEPFSRRSAIATPNILVYRREFGDDRLFDRVKYVVLPDQGEFHQILIQLPSQFQLLERRGILSVYENKSFSWNPKIAGIGDLF